MTSLQMGKSVPSASKSRRVLPLTIFKRVRTLIIDLYNIQIGRLSRHGSGRSLSTSTASLSSRTRALFSVPLLICLFLIVVPLMIILHHSQPHFRFADDHKIHEPLHEQLEAPEHHFDPPSLFHPAVCVRKFDQSWSVLLRSTPSPVPSSPKSFAQIAFAIQASGDTIHLLPRLLSRIHHPRNVYVIHIDAKVERSLRDDFERSVHNNTMYAANVHIMPAEMLTYKGISTVLNSIAMMTLAFDVHPDWDYYINLSASDYPLISPNDMATLLARPQAPPGLLNFVWFFPRKDWKPYSFRVRHMFWDPAASGYQHTTNRLHYLARQKENPLEKHRAYVFTKAEAWVILSRPFVAFIIRSSFVKRMLLSHMHVLSVSEHLITDILFNHPVWRTTVVPDAFRQVVWYYRGRRSGQHPYSLDRGPTPDAFWNDISGTASMFVRKFTKPNSPILDRIDLEINGFSCNDSRPDCATYSSTRSHFFKRIVQKFDSLTQTTLEQQQFKWPKTAYPTLRPL